MNNINTNLINQIHPVKNQIIGNNITSNEQSRKNVSVPPNSLPVENYSRMAVDRLSLGFCPQLANNPSTQDKSNKLAELMLTTDNIAILLACLRYVQFDELVEIVSKLNSIKAELSAALFKIETESSLVALTINQDAYELSLKSIAEKFAASMTSAATNLAAATVSTAGILKNIITSHVEKSHNLHERMQKRLEKLETVEESYKDVKATDVVATSKNGFIVQFNNAVKKHDINDLAGLKLIIEQKNKSFDSIIRSSEELDTILKGDKYKNLRLGKIQAEKEVIKSLLDQNKDKIQLAERSAISIADQTRHNCDTISRVCQASGELSAGFLHKKSETASANSQIERDVAQAKRDQASSLVELLRDLNNRLSKSIDSLVEDVTKLLMLYSDLFNRIK